MSSASYRHATQRLQSSHRNATHRSREQADQILSLHLGRLPRGGGGGDGDGNDDGVGYGGHGGFDRRVGARVPLPALLRGHNPDGPPVARGARCHGAPPLRGAHGRRAFLHLLRSHVQPPLRHPHDVWLPRHAPLSPPRGAHHLPRGIRLPHRMVNSLPPTFCLQWGCVRV